MKTFSGKLFELESGGPDAAPHIRAVIAHMIRLSVMTLALLRRPDVLVLVGRGPALDDRQHDEGYAPRFQHAVDLGKCPLIVHMFENM